MGDLITSGDTINNFGKFLPTPYIKKAYLSNSTDDNQIIVDVDLDIYIRASENTDIIALLNSMGDLRLYVALNFDGFPSGSDYDDEIPMDIDELLNNEQSVWDFYFASDWYGACAGGAYTNYSLSKYVTLSELNTDDDWSTLYTIVYDDEGNRTAKLSFSLQIDSSAKTYGGSCANFEWVDPYPIDVDVYLFSWIVAPDSIPEDDTEYKALSSYAKRFLNLETSEIAYEHIWSGEDEAIPVGEETIWKDSNGDLYDGTPIQSLSSKYYTTDGITQADIITLFKSLLEEYETTAQSDEALQNVMDQISYILETQQNSSDLLIQLSLLRRAFTSKTGATNTGKLYIGFKAMISTANEAVKNGKIITKQAITNNKVIDKTFVDTLEYAAPTDLAARIALEDITSSAYSGPVRWTAMEVDSPIHTPEYCPTDGGNTFVDGMLLSVSTIPAGLMGDPYNTEVACFYGWAFFDYDKALYETACIGQYLDMKTLQLIMGDDVLIKYFKITQAALSRHDTTWAAAWLNEDGSYGSVSARIDNGYETVGCAIGSDTGESQNLEDVVEQTTIASITDSYGNQAYPFLFLRNFQRAGDREGIEAYLDGPAAKQRMLGFEFQYFSINGSTGIELDYDHHEDNSFPALWFGVLVEDTTMKLLGDLSTIYEQAQSEFGEYVSAAEEACALDADTGYFVESFATAQEELYAGDMSKAPWNYYPMLYVIFRELFTQKWEADEDAMTSAAEAYAEKINPTSGTLLELQEFEGLFNELYDLLMSADEDEESIGSIVQAALEYEGRVGDREYSTEILFSNWKAYDDLIPLCTSTLGVGEAGGLAYYSWAAEDLPDGIATSPGPCAWVKSEAVTDTFGPAPSDIAVISYGNTVFNAYSGISVDGDFSESDSSLDNWPTVPYTPDMYLIFRITFNEPLYGAYTEGTYNEGTNLYSNNDDYMLLSGLGSSGYFEDKRSEGRGMGPADVGKAGSAWIYIKDAEDPSAGLTYMAQYVDIWNYGDHGVWDVLNSIYVTVRLDEIEDGVTYGVYFDPSPIEHAWDAGSLKTEDGFIPPLVDANGYVATKNEPTLLFEFVGEK